MIPYSLEMFLDTNSLVMVIYKYFEVIRSAPFAKIFANCFTFWSRIKKLVLRDPQEALENTNRRTGFKKSYLQMSMSNIVDRGLEE